MGMKRADAMHRKNSAARSTIAIPIQPRSVKALALWAEHVERCAGNIIIARAAESVALPQEEASELCAA